MCSTGRDKHDCHTIRHGSRDASDAPRTGGGSFASCPRHCAESPPEVVLVDVESEAFPRAGLATTGFVSPVAGRAGLATPTAGFTTPAAGGLETPKPEKEGSFLLMSAHPSVGTGTAIVAPQDVQPASEDISAPPLATVPTQLLNTDTCGGRPATSTVLLATHRTPHEHTARVLPLPSVAPELQTSKDIAKHLMAGAREVLEKMDESGCALGEGASSGS